MAAKAAEVVADETASERRVGARRTCTSCETVDDVVAPSYDGDAPLCRECRAPLCTLDFPELYCDLGGGD